MLSEIDNSTSRLGVTLEGGDSIDSVTLLKCDDAIAYLFHFDSTTSLNGSIR